MYTIICQQCSKLHKTKNKGVRFCSRECTKRKYDDGFIIIRMNGVPPKPRRYIFFRDHPNSRNKTIPYAHWVMEKHIRRFIKKGEIVHHKDGNQLNDDISNLQLLKNRLDHSKIHSFEKGFGLPFTQTEEEIILEEERLYNIFGIDNIDFLFEDPSPSKWSKKIKIPKIKNIVNPYEEIDSMPTFKEEGHKINCLTYSPNFIKRVKSEVYEYLIKYFIYV